MEEYSQIQNFYKDSTILLTGATGFLGKLLLEKLLQSCNIKRIYLMMRDKKNQFAKDRLQNMLDSPIFNRLKQEKPNFMQHLVLIEGDCSEKDLMLSSIVRKRLQEEVQIVFHVAATIRFDQSLTTAAIVNLKATKYLTELVANMSQLKAFIYTSTAYSNCSKDLINEVIYKNRFEAVKFLQFLDNVNEDLVNQATINFLDGLPNAYVLTKALTEELLFTFAKSRANKKHYPVVVVRPSILSSTFKEPLPGWVDSWFTIGTISVATSYGLLRTANTDPDKLADIVPADYVANCLIASAIKAEEWNITEFPVLNYVSSTEAPITWGDYTKKCFQNGLEYIPSLCYRYPNVALTKYRHLYLLRRFYRHDLPAVLIDFICYVLGSEFRVRKYYQLLHRYLDDTAYFSTREWKFSNDRVQQLWTSLSKMDQELFPFAMQDFDWDEYILQFLKNGRVHLLQENEDSLPRARRRLKVLKILHYFICFFEYFVISLFVSWVFLKIFY